ncbi:hypothetical protein BZG36_01687 [Bifiguratus adelaidae]|uniref:AB hydrolase-1 domain-containing protein n=1 Tax=Bifiguratus adelaidae TaxID=1938954 RepID=A0A261Y4N9_9FUNG|nr:hypothetical protein BZG36_01687 [Bifiguratus adelaidae]
MLLFNATCIALLLYIALLVALCFPPAQDAAVYLHWVNFPFHVNWSAPERFGFGHNKVRNLYLKTPDNITLGAWHILPTHYYHMLNLRDMPTEQLTDSVYDEALSNQDYDTILYFHGNAGNRAAPWRVQTYMRMADRWDVNVITVDYRGFGNSEGKPSEDGLHMDAMTVWNWAVKEKGASPERTVILGHSLGTGIATRLAYELGQKGITPRGLVLLAPYSSIPNVVFEYTFLSFISIFYPIKPFPYIQDFLLSRLNTKFDSLSYIEHINCTTLIAYGAKDTDIPIHHSARLFHRAIHGAEHYSEYATDWMRNDINVGVYTIPSEGTWFHYQHEGGRRVDMVELTHGHHNNVPLFDLAFEVMGQVTAVDGIAGELEMDDEAEPIEPFVVE